MLALLLLACAEQAPEQDVVGNDAEQGAPLEPAAPGEPGGLTDDRTPVAEDAFDASSPQGAAQVLQRYFALVEAGRKADADKLWSDSASKAAFDRRLVQYREVHATIGAPGEPNGPAGLLYLDVPVQLYGRLPGGKPFNARGTMTPRPANAVRNSTAEQRQWRIDKSEFAAPPATPAYRFVGRWATQARNCRTLAWRFTATSLSTPAGSQCTFIKIAEVPGGYDIAARCTAEGPPANDTLKLRFAESAKALLFESEVIADAGLERCS